MGRGDLAGSSQREALTLTNPAYRVPRPPRTRAGTPAASMPPGISISPPDPRPPRIRHGIYLKMLTARAITSPPTAREPVAWMVMASLPQRASGITSVGLNAVALVNAR